MPISVCLPTRGRPDRMSEMVESIANTASGPVQVAFAIDDDDKASIKRATQLFTTYKGRVDVRSKVVKRGAFLMSDLYNRAAEIATGDILMECCDSVLFHSPGWDELVEAEFAKVPDRILLVFGRDGIHDGRAATLPFLHRRWMEVLGRFMPPYFSCDYCDTWVWEVAKMLDRIVYVPEVFTQHRHPEAGTAPLDQTKIDGYARGERDNNGAIFQQGHAERVEEANKLRTVMP